MKNLIKIIIFLLSPIVYSQEKEALIENPNFDLYIYFSKFSKLDITKIKHNTTYFEYYKLAWPSTVNYKKLSLKINDKGNLVTSISMVGSGKTINLVYKNEKKQNLPLKVDKNESLNIIKYEDFIYYEIDLFKFLKKAKNLYVIIENETKGNFYIAKKVELTESGSL